jgi:hypothetical protein
MKTIFVGLLVFAFTLSAWSQKNKGTDKTIVGEVVDVQCYVSGATGPGKGQDHKDCAIQCAKGGIPLAILEDKTNILYVAGQTKVAMKSANEMLIPFIAEKVKVSGRVYEKGGVKLILIKKIGKQNE